jgi:hypothetical protein
MSRESLQEEMKSFLEESKWTSHIEELLKELRFFNPEDPWLFLYEKGGLRQQR